MSTEQNLKDSFAGESQANRRYLAFAKKAADEGFKQVGKLFRAAAEAETVHAMADLRLLGAVKPTTENLETAIAGENYEATQMYPKFASEATAEGNKTAATIFGYLAEVETVHHGLYEEALAAVESGKDLAAQKIYVCAVCGNTVVGAAPDNCPICGSPKKVFTEIK